MQRPAVGLLCNRDDGLYQLYTKHLFEDTIYHTIINEKNIHYNTQQIRHKKSESIKWAYITSKNNTLYLIDSEFLKTENSNLTKDSIKTKISDLILRFRRSNKMSTIYGRI